MFQPNKNIKNFAFIFGVMSLFLGLSYMVLAWTEPSVNPPGVNVDKPLNVGSVSQSKVGGG